MEEEVRRFEFAELAAEQYRELRPGRIAALAMGALAFVLLLLSMLSVAGVLPGYQGGWTNFRQVVIAGEVAIVAITLASYALNSGVYPATSLLLDSKGVRLEFLSGREEFFAWRGPRAGLTVVEWTRVRQRWTPQLRDATPERNFTIRALRPRHSPISAEAFNEILNQSRYAGSTVLVENRGGSPFTETVYRIQGSS